MQKYLESPLSIQLLGGEFSAGDTVFAEVDEEADKLVFRLAEDAQVEAEEAQLEPAEV